MSFECQISLQVDIIGGLSAGFNVGVVRLLRLAKIARALSSSDEEWAPLKVDV